MPGPGDGGIASQQFIIGSTMADFRNFTLGASERIFYGNPIADWLLAGLLALAVWSGLSLMRRFIAARSKRYSGDHRSTPVRLAFYLAGNTKQFFFLALALYAGQEGLMLTPRLQHVLANVALILILVQVGLWAGRSLRFYLEIKEMERGSDRLFAGSLDIINFVARLVIWSLLTLVALDNLGVNITALLAGLGVGGVAVALAVQSILGDLFASLSIVIDKPFVIGDFVIVDDYMGTIEHVGLKTTRIRSLGGEQIVFSNSDLLKTRIRNYKRMRERRVLFGFGVLYQTPIEVVEKIPALVRAIVEARQKVRFERAHFKGFGESALDFEVVYWMLDPDYNLYMDVQQAINLEMLRVFEREGIGFAYPTRTLVIDGPVRVEQSQEKEEAERESTGRKPSGRLDGDAATAARR